MKPERHDSQVIEEYLQTRREDAFLQIYRRHTPKLYLFALRLTGGKRQDAEELLQECWIRAVRKLPTFKPDGKLINWLMGIACNCYREMARKPRLEQLSEKEAGAAPDGYASAVAEQLIRKLPDGAREVLILHDLYGYTHEETAALLNIHPGTSKSQLHDARKKLRSCFFKEEK